MRGCPRSNPTGGHKEILDNVREKDVPQERHKESKDVPCLHVSTRGRTSRLRRVQTVRVRTLGNVDLTQTRTYHPVVAVGEGCLGRHPVPETVRFRSESGTVTYQISTRTLGWDCHSELPEEGDFTTVTLGYWVDLRTPLHPLWTSGGRAGPRLRDTVVQGPRRVCVCQDKRTGGCDGRSKDPDRSEETNTVPYFTRDRSAKWVNKGEE